MDIVDAQIHIGPGRIDETLAAMDALGIRAVLIDEYWFGRKMGEPSYEVGPARRPVQPTAELAAMTHPDRFSYLVRVDRQDRDLAAIIRMAGDAPYARAIRVSPGMSRSERQAFADGGYAAVCAACCDAGLPLFVFAPDQAAAFAHYAAKYPSLKIAVDHCGLFSTPMRKMMTGNDAPFNAAAQSAAFEEVLALAALPNIALKWGHAPAMFETPGYPGDALAPHLRKALDRFGAARVMWASDVSANQTGESWAELLFGIRTMPGLSEAESAAVLGGSARAWLNWPA